MAISDFGEKIGGAKKDLWKERHMILDDLSEMNAAEKEKFIKKDNVWQKPDYADLVANGIPVKVAYFIKTVRDSLGAKPVITNLDITPEDKLDKQEKYIQFVGAIRDAVMGCKSEEDVLRLGNQNWLYDNGYIESVRSYYVKPTSAAGGLISNKFLKAFCVNSYDLRRYEREIERKQFLYTDEQKIVSKYDFFKYENVTWEKDYDDRLRMSIKIPGGSMFMYPRGEFADEASWKVGTFFVIDKSHHNIVSRNFATEEAAKKFVVDRDSGKEAEKPKKKGKSRFVPVQLEHIKRDGDDVRNGRAITGQDYLSKFDFKGGEFGNWMSEKDRQASLNFGYEALYDLVKALKLDFKDVSLGKSLSIAFGARGSAGALAHYEPLCEVINLTKMRGAGSLAHEWAHALDDIIGKKIGLDKFMTSQVYDKRVPESMKNLVNAMKYKEVADDAATARRQKEVEDYISRVRRHINGFFPVSRMSEEQIARKDELVRSYIDNAPNVDSSFFAYITSGVGITEIDALSDFKKELTGRVIPKEDRINLARYQNGIRSRMENVDRPMRVHTEFYDNSIKFDKLHAKTDHGYWQSNEEMFARAFACYVQDKVAGRSDYLCGHAELAISLVSNPSTGTIEYIRAYPDGEERQIINNCFDALIQELKEMGFLHHKEDFMVEQSREPTEPVWDRLPETEEEAYPVSLLDLLDDAYERSESRGSGEQLSFELDKGFGE